VSAAGRPSPTSPLATPPPAPPLPAEVLLPPRRPGSVRRTASLDMRRPEGSLGPLRLLGRARDLVTPARGGARTAGEGGLEATVGPDGRLQSLRTTPSVPEGRRLVGERAGPGFRRLLEAVCAAQCAARSPLYLLLDELPVAVMITGYAVARDPAVSQAVRDAASGLRPDVCAGWRVGGALLRAVDADQPRPLREGVPASALERADDPLAWHALDPLGPGVMRRRRRLDVIAGDPLEIDAMLRDSFVEADGVETILHEYGLRAAVDARSGRVLRAAATAGVLPLPDCPLAVDSAPRIEGLAAAELRERVREALRGPSTCTHLNDLLRCLADAPGLAAVAARSASGVEEPA
jgi:hypothetical protein